MAKKSSIIRPYPNNNALLRMFCFHHIGGDASSYRGWQVDLPFKCPITALGGLNDANVS